MSRQTENFEVAYDDLIEVYNEVGPVPHEEDFGPASLNLILDLFRQAGILPPEGNHVFRTVADS